MNSVSIYGILNTKKLNTHFVFFGLLYLPIGVSIIRLQQQSANIFGLHILLYLF